MSRRVTIKSNEPEAKSDGITNDHGFGPASDAVPYNFEINLFELAQLLFNRRRLLIGLSFAIMTLTAVYLLLQPNRFTSTATILPSGGNNGLSELSSLVGLSNNLGGVDENSSALYPVVLRSNLIVDAVLDDTYSFTHKSQPMTTTLSDYFGIENRDRLRQALREITTVNSDNPVGEINVGVETVYPALSQAILKNYLARLEDFNRNKRRSSARENEKYLSRQLVTVQEELHAAEDKLETFQKTNLDWAVSGSPEILKELGRLQREVSVKSATYTMLLQEDEMAKLDAQKDIPIVRILDEPSFPTVKSGPFRRNVILMSGILCFMLLSFALILIHLIRQVGDGDNQGGYETLRQDFQEAFPRTRTALNRIRTIIVEKTPLIKS